jgi:hypothetical protein
MQLWSHLRVAAKLDLARLGAVAMTARVGELDCDDAGKMGIITAQTFT